MLTSITAYSYGIAAVAFFMLIVLLLTSWRARTFGTALTVACVMSAFWAASITYQAASGVSVPLLTDILEILRNAGWTIFLLMLLGPFQQTNSLPPFKFKLKPYVVGIIAFYCLFLLVNIYFYWTLESLQGKTGFMPDIVGRVVMAVTGMLLVEQLYRNTPAKGRWGIKFACLGIGGMFVYDFYLYSEAMLFRQVNMEIWNARGAVNALIVPLVAVSAARNPQWSLGISVSRRILFHSATLLGTALYLLAMSAAGYYLRFFGGNWGAVMQVTFLFGAVALLVGILFSGVFRSWLKVFISKHFYNYNYDYREEWLGFTRTLSGHGHGHGLGERTIQAVAALVESPGGALFISRESGNCEPAAHWNMSLPNESEPANGSLCQFLESKQWLIDLQEYESNPEKYGAIFIPQWLREVSKGWLIVPLILLGKLFGFMVLMQPRSKVKLNWEVIDLLKIAGSQAASYLAQQESANALMVARQFESFNRMSTFIVHDLKNLVSQLSLLLSNAEKHKHNPEFQKDMLDTLDYSVQKMKLLLHKLSRGSSIESPSSLLIDKLLRHTLALKSAFEPKPELEVLVPDLMVVANWDRLERVIGHIIQNAVEATPKDGKVTIRISKLDAFVVVEIKDTGHGMSEEFIHERLFKPFETTKSAGMGIGMFESREYIHELGGRIEVSSCPAAGTTFQVLLPFHGYVDHSNEATLREE